METFSALLAICAGISPVPGEFPTQRPVTRSFDVFLDLRLNKPLSKQPWGWWFESLSRPLRRHRNDGINCAKLNCSRVSLSNGYPSSSASNAVLWCFLCYRPEQAFEQTIEWPVISGAIMLRWCHYNKFGQESGMQSSCLVVSNITNERIAMKIISTCLSHKNWSK